MAMDTSELTALIDNLEDALKSARVAQTAGLAALRPQRAAAPS